MHTFARVYLLVNADQNKISAHLYSYMKLHISIHTYIHMLSHERFTVRTRRHSNKDNRTIFTIDVGLKRQNIIMHMCHSFMSMRHSF